MSSSNRNEPKLISSLLSGVRPGRLCELNYHVQFTPLLICELIYLTITQTAHVTLLQLPRAWVEDLAWFLHIDVELSADPLIASELIVVQPAVEPEGPALKIQMEELGCAYGEIVFVTRGKFALLLRMVVVVFGRFIFVLVLVLVSVSGLEVVRVLDDTHDSGVALVEAVFRVANEFPADPESFFVT
jgi:hypothetical protein